MQITLPWEIIAVIVSLFIFAVIAYIVPNPKSRIFCIILAVVFTILLSSFYVANRKTEADETNRANIESNLPQPWLLLYHNLRVQNYFDARLTTAEVFFAQHENLPQINTRALMTILDEFNFEAYANRATAIAYINDTIRERNLLKLE